MQVPELLLPEGRKLTFERGLQTDRDVRPKPGFFTKVFDLVVGKPDLHFLVRPYSVVEDSRGRIIVTDPGAQGVHIFDPVQQKYKFIERKEKSKDAMLAPQCVAVDSKDNIYVSDSESGKIFVFNSDGKFQHALGSLKGGEGFFKRPTGIAVDSDEQKIYITDTLRNKIFVTDMNGNVLQTIGKTGDGVGEFNYPTELRLDGKDLLVVDAMNFRVQAVDRSGQFLFGIGAIGDGTGSMFRPKGIGVDSEGHVYVVEGSHDMVQVFDREGRLLYYFGQQGTGFGDFRLPTGLFVDHNDKVFVVDSYNRRVQIFQYHALKQAKGGVAVSARVVVRAFRPASRLPNMIRGFSPGGLLSRIAGSIPGLLPAREAKALLYLVLAFAIGFASLGTAMAQVNPPTKPADKGKRGEETQRPAQQSSTGQPDKKTGRKDITGDVIGMHNLSPGSPSPIQGPGNGPCLYCHVPHSASNVGLWNQTFSTATYTTYTSTTLSNRDNSQLPLGADSNMCLSCHDGTVAVADTVLFGQLPTSGNWIQGDNFSTQLQSSHPFSLVLPLKDNIDLISTLVSSGKDWR